MCGIAGLVALNGSTLDQRALDTLTDAVSHRGPDGRGTFMDLNVGLGHRRLRIIDLSDAAAQPMVSADATVALTFNGEIYNFQEERARLEQVGRTFRSKSDTEVLLALYEEEGIACVERLRGQFAFAIFDRNAKQLHLVRDRLGKKPLLYFATDSTFAFSSDVVALRTLPDCPKEIDWEALHDYLTLMYLPAPRTGILGIRKLPAAHILTLDIETGQQHLRKYWGMQYEEKDRPLEEWEHDIRETFRESVRLRMIADVPVGVFLSGGVDSAAVVATAAGLTDRPLKTFSIGSDEPRLNELPDAERIAKIFGTDHQSIPLEADIVHILPELVRMHGEPFADPSSIPMFLLARAVKPSVTVALNGDGGDENFAGYVRYPILRFSRKWENAPPFLHAFALAVTKGAERLHPTTFTYRCRRFEQSLHLPWERRYLQYLSFFTDNEKRKIYNASFRERFDETDIYYGDRTAAARHSAKDVVHQAMSMDIDTYLADDLLPKVDRATMASAVEGRSPFLDHKLLELTSGLPVDLLIRGKHRKWILKHMFEGQLPHDHLWKRKRGFRLPLDSWFRGPLKGFVTERLMTGHPNFWEMFDRHEMENFLNHYYDTQIDYSDHMWSLLWLREWMEQYT